MVESQTRRTGQRVPVDSGGVVGCTGTNLVDVDPGEVDDADGAAARVSAGLAEGVKLFERTRAHTAFLEEFATGGVREVFIHVDEAARDRPLAGIRFVLAA